MKALLLAALLLGGCLLKPDRIDIRDDARPHDAAGSDAAIDALSNKLNVRVLQNAWFEDPDGAPPPVSSGGMTNLNYSILTSGASDGDLLIFIMNVDNGSDSVIPTPTGFQQVFEHFYGAYDGQTYAVFYKKSNGVEPAQLTGTYQSGINSAAATITLLAVRGWDPTPSIPIGDKSRTDGDTSMGTAPVMAVSTGVTPTAPGSLLIYAAGADWLGSDNTSTADLPSGYTKLAAFGDKGESTLDMQWTSQMVGWAIADTADPTGPVTGTFTSSTVTGVPWAVMLAIPPAP